MKVFCIGRNYADHAKEMKAEVPQEPVYFMKPDTAVLKEKDFYYPSFTQNLHYEVEIVLKISKVGKNIAVDFAKNYYQEMTLGIDFTARDLQEKCKAKGTPWEIAKSWDNSAPIASQWFAVQADNFHDISFGLKKNGNWVQQGNSREMLFGFDEIVSYLSKFHTLKVGDLIFTGTPAGVGPVEIGDQLDLFFEDQCIHSLSVL